MLFEKYCELMRTHGIGELFFDYGNKEYCISTDFIKFKIVYTVSDENENLYREFDDFEELLSAELFDGKKLLVAFHDETSLEYNGKKYCGNKGELLIFD